jgi:ribosome-binding factor A
MKKISKKQKQLSASMHKALSTMLQENRQGSFSFGCFVGINEVVASPQMDVADIYVSVFNEVEEGSVIKQLRESTKEIRYILARTLDWRKMPELRFHSDDIIETALSIEATLNKLKKKS